MYAKCNDVSVRVYFPTTTRLVQRGKARVPERTNLHSFNLLWLMWAVCGGFFITNFLLCNYLQVLLKEVYEMPVDTSKVWRFKNENIHIIFFRMFMTED